MALIEISGLSTAQFNALDKKLDQLIAKENKLAQELETLKQQVAANTTVIGSAKDLLVGLKKKLDDAIASGDPAQLTALSDELKTQDDALAAAVVANTPATPTP